LPDIHNYNLKLEIKQLFGAKITNYYEFHR
jgi:hypothetical protein